MISNLFPRASSFSEKVLWGSIHAAERWMFTDNFIVSNRTPYEEIFRDDIMSVRHYEALEDSEIALEDHMMPVSERRFPIPLILVPPLAATSMIFDLLPQRSVVRYFLARGFDVYLIDWGDVTADHSHLSLQNYVNDWMPMAMDAVRHHSGKAEVSCFCYCMGGLLTLLYAASFRDHPIRNLVTVASPVDMHQSGLAGRVLSMVYRPAQILSRILNFSFMDLPARYTHVPGWVNSLAFKMTNPLGSVISSLELLVNLWDREYVKVHTTMSQWFDDMVDYPGETIKEIVVKMGMQNQMAQGRVSMGERQALFSDIDCAILAIAGSSDKLVSPQAAHHVLDIVSSEDKEFAIASGGHAGVFAGSSAPSETWAISGDWLAARSE